MKRALILLMNIIVPFCLLACDGWKQLQSDTIDFSSIRRRVFFEMPANSIKISTEILDCEGVVVIYPLFLSPEKFAPITIDCSVMNRNHLIYTDDIDLELWNTFNRNNIGSRCFIKNGLYYRVDRYYEGLEIYYNDLPEELLDLANKIMKSVYITVLKKEDKPLPPINGKLWIMETTQSLSVRFPSRGLSGYQMTL